MLSHHLTFAQAIFLTGLVISCINGGNRYTTYANRLLAAILIVVGAYGTWLR